VPSHPLSARLVGKLFGVLGLLVGLSAAAVAAPPTLTSPVRLPGDALIGPAAGSQTGPAIARGGSGYLVVWTDDRAALSPPLGFSGGPYFGSGLGSMLDIYAARLDANGVLIDTTPIVIAQNGYNQSFPQVAWNGQNWLVTWVGEREPYYYTDIYAARVSPGGQVFDSTPILVDVAETTNTRVATAVASDGANWTVVWQDIDSQAGIFTLDAARVSPAGVVLDPGGKRLRRPAWNSYPYAPRLAFAGSQYLLVWHEGVDTGNVVAQRFSPTLAPLGSPFSINRQIEISKGEKVRVASNGTDFLVAWHEARYQIGELIAARVSATGVVLDPNGIFIEPDGGVTDFAPDVAWDGARWFVAYHMPATGVDHDLYVKRLSPAGAMLDASRRLVLNGVWDQNRPVIAPTGAGGVQLAAITRPAASPGPDDVATLRVAATGAAGAASIASVGAPRQVAPRMAAGSNG
jgi:large repetitive protein